MKFKQLPALIALALGPAAPALAAPGGTVVIVSQIKAAPEVLASDAAMLAHVQTLGYTARIVDNAEPATAAAGADVILISAGSSAHKLEDRYRAVRTPVIVMESYTLRFMGMAGLREDEDFGTRAKERYIQLVNAPHPLSAGLPAGLLNTYARGTSMNWARPGLGAATISVLPGEPLKATEFAYEAGATMDGENLAPARRMFFFLDNTAFPNLNVAGLKLFDAAIAWAMARR